EEAADDRARGGEQLLAGTALGFGVQHLGTVASCLQLGAQLGHTVLVLVLELRRLLVRLRVGGFAATRGERLGRFARAPEQFEIAVDRNVDSAAADEVVDEIALEARPEGLVLDRRRRQSVRARSRSLGP